MRYLQVWLWLFFVCVLISCSSIVKTDKAWKAQDIPGTPYQRVLVVGIAPDPNMRLSFEDIMTDTLNRHDVSAVASHKFIEHLNQESHALLQNVAGQASADAILVTQPTSHSEYSLYTLATGHAEYRVVEETETTADTSTSIGMAGAVYIPGEMDTEGATLRTDLFDVASAQKVWTAMSNAAGGDNAEIDVIWKLSAQLTKALGEDGLIVINSKDFKIP